MLLDHGANPNSIMRRTRMSSLHLAASNGFSEVCRTLLSKGAYVDTRDYNGLTPEEYAQMSPQPPMVATKDQEGIEAADSCLMQMRQECQDTFAVL